MSRRYSFQNAFFSTSHYVKFVRLQARLKSRDLRRIPACRRPADRSRRAATSVEYRPAPASPITSARRRTVDPSARFTPSASAIGLVCDRSAKIPVRDRVVSELSAQSSITCRSALVRTTTREIRSPTAFPNHVSLRGFFF